MRPARRAQAGQPTNADARSVGPITRRLVYALVLIPIVPAVSSIGTYIGASNLTVGGFDELRWFHLCFAVLWVVATIGIWRSVIVWTLGRKWLTALISMIPFVQACYGQPLWILQAPGCNFLNFNPEILRIGQHEMGIGFSVWLAIWVWWGWEKRRMSITESKENFRTARMTPVAKRLAASIGNIPFLFGTFLIVGVALDDLFPAQRDMTPQAFAVTAVVGVAVWLLIWRRAVAWSPAAISRTAIAALLCLGLPVAAQLLFWERVDGLFEVILGCLPVIGWGVWMAVTISLWQTRPSELSESDRTPRCLKCGYLLIGLRATRCPECGDEPTLDDLWRATAGTI